MKALQILIYGEIKDSLAFNEVSKPTVQANDVLIEVEAAAINPIDKSIILETCKVCSQYLCQVLLLMT